MVIMFCWIAHAKFGQSWGAIHHLIFVLLAKCQFSRATCDVAHLLFSSTISKASMKAGILIAFIADVNPFRFTSFLIPGDFIPAEKLVSLDVGGTLAGRFLARSFRLMGDDKQYQE